MKVIPKEKYHILKDEENDIAGFATYLTHKHASFEHTNVVVDLLDKNIADPKELLLFLEISNLHRSLHKSFVIATGKVAVDAIPEELIVVPTLREAEDIINMEELERELGF